MRPRLVPGTRKACLIEADRKRQRRLRDLLRAVPSIHRRLSPVTVRRYKLDD